MTKPVEQPVQLSRKATIGFWVGTILLFSFMLAKCSEEPGVSAAQRKRYDSCMLEKGRLGVGIIKADSVCAYWKRANP